MIEQKIEEANNQKNEKKETLRKIFFCIAKIFGIIATLIGVIGGYIKIHEYFFAEPDLKYSFAKYKIAKVTVYSGELINNDSTHAIDLMLKGKFNSKIVDLEVTSSDAVKKDINNPIGSVEVSLNHLSKKSTCAFDIIVDQESEILEQIQVSWGNKGKLLLEPKDSDEKIMKGIKLREKVSGLDLSRKARHKWFEHNAKNIRK